MMKKVYLILIISLQFITSFAQVSKAEQSFEGHCKYLEGSNYIINTKSVYYENCAIHRKVKADPSTFKNVGDGLAYDNKNIFVKGMKLDIKPQNPVLISLDDYYANKKNTYWKNGGITYKDASEIKEIPKVRKTNYNVNRTQTQLSFDKDNLLLNDYFFCKKELFTASGFTNFKKIEVVSVIKGYRRGCSQDTQPGSDYYILKNKKGYWKFKRSAKNTLTYIGEDYNF